ncbi:MAG: hypothetical protein Solumvirus5_31 [Solumvirus sp.]|uniref:Uncharacterized protein n=1 Tax=Solumvirus sp. TaxID=2487773 RepID=A0A3G5AIE9_9VIRU|nr:MAG: hypothetical protein Solumvirus5_31 [Solumvirus sp.]
MTSLSVLGESLTQDNNTSLKLTQDNNTSLKLTQDQKLSDQYVTNVQHTRFAAGSDLYLYKDPVGDNKKDTEVASVDIKGIFELDDPSTTGLPIVSGYSEKKVDINKLKINTSFTGAHEYTEGNYRFRREYIKDVLNGSSLIYEKEKLIQEEVYNNGLLIQQVFYLPGYNIPTMSLVDLPEFVNGRITHLYTYPDPYSTCTGPRGTNEPCRDILSTPLTLGRSSYQDRTHSKTVAKDSSFAPSKTVFNLLIRDEKNKPLVNWQQQGPNKWIVYYYRYDAFWAQLTCFGTTVDSSTATTQLRSEYQILVKGKIKMYSKENIYGEFDIYDGKIVPGWADLWEASEVGTLKLKFY